jgi:type II secretory pathway component PulF
MLAKFAFDAAVRMRLWEKLATQIENGMDLKSIVRKQRDGALANRSCLAVVYDEALKTIESGNSLGQGFRNFAPQEEILLITSGQESGIHELVNSLHLAAEVIDAKKKIISAVLEAVIYPAFLLCLIAVFLYIVATSLVPNLAGLSDPEGWEGAAKSLYLVSSFLVSPYGVGAVILFVVSTCATLVSLPIWTGGLRLVADRFPPWSIYRLYVGTVWLLTIATFMRSGIPLSRGLQRMLSGNVSPWLHERVQAIQMQYGRGINFGEALYNAKMHFPDPEIVDEFRDYAALPGFVDKIHKLSLKWQSDGISRIQRNSLIAKTVLFALIILIAGSSLAAIYSLQQQITGGQGLI